MEETEALAEFGVDVDIFGAQVGVFIDREEFMEWLRDRELDNEADKIHELEGCARWVVDPNGSSYFLLLLPVDVGPGLIAHECSHSAWQILEAHGVREPTFDHHEIHAQLLELLVRRVYDGLTRINSEEDAEIQSHELDGSGD